MLVYSSEKFYLVVINEAVNLGWWITLTSTTIKSLQWKYFIRVNLTTIKDYLTFHKKAGLTASHMAILRRENVTHSVEIYSQQACISPRIKIAVNIWYWSGSRHLWWSPRLRSSHPCRRSLADSRLYTPAICYLQLCSILHCWNITKGTTDPGIDCFGQ